MTDDCQQLVTSDVESDRGGPTARDSADDDIDRMERMLLNTLDASQLAAMLAEVQRSKKRPAKSKKKVSVRGTKRKKKKNESKKKSKKRKRSRSPSSSSDISESESPRREKRSKNLRKQSRKHARVTLILFDDVIASIHR